MNIETNNNIIMNELPPTHYICANCCIMDTTKFSNIKNHFLRKNICRKKTDIILLSEDQILTMSLIPYHYDKHTIDSKDLEYLSKSNIISNNKLELFSEIDKIEKKRDKKCNFCSEEFNLISELRTHIISKCFYKELCKKNIQNEEINKDSDNIINSTLNSNNNLNSTVNSHNTTNNNTTNNNTTNNNTTNNYNLYFNLPIPFEEDWDISEISKLEKEGIIISQYVFTRFLTEILKNEKNSNVIIDKDNKSGMVYMDHKNKYIEMKGKDIIEKTMEKLYDQLNDIIDNNNESLKMIKQISKEFIHDKFNEYFENNETKEVIDENIYNSYDKNLEQANNVGKNVMKIDKIKVLTNKKSKKEPRNRREKIDKKTRMDQMKECKYDDYYYLYDSDGNNKL